MGMTFLSLIGQVHFQSKDCWVAYIANNMYQDQTSPKGSSLIRVHSICFHDKISLGCIPILGADLISKQHFSEQGLIESEQFTLRIVVAEGRWSLPQI